MVRVDFPTALLEPEYLGSLIREQAEDFVIKVRTARLANWMPCMRGCPQGVRPGPT
jgi:hypothetical protein